jgi:hypothetical protein
VIRAALATDRSAGLIGRMLTSAPVVVLGRMSYSLYLWHWPLWVMAGYGRSEALAPLDRFVLMAAAFVPALLSWRFVERPINERRLLAGSKPLLTVLAICAAVLVSAGVWLDHAGRGEFSIRLLPPDVLALANGQFDWVRGDCWPSDLADRRKPCRFGAPDRAPTIVLWGNSFARMWMPGLDAKGREVGMAGLGFHRGKCLPLPGAIAGDPADCRAFNGAVLDYIRTHPALSTVVLGANWFAAGPQLATLQATLASLRDMGRRVILIAAPPQPTYAVPRALALALLRQLPPPPPLLESAARAAQKDSTDLIEGLRQSYGFTMIDPASFLCDGETCHVEQSGRALYYDAGHVTAYAARLGKDVFDPVFQP